MSEGSDEKCFVAPILASNRPKGKEDDTPALSDLSERDKPWDKHRANCDTTANYYKGSQFDRYSERMNECSGLLDFRLELTKQLHRTKAIAVGGILREYMKELEAEPDDLVGKDNEGEVDEGHLYFGWRSRQKKYKLIDN